MIIRRFWIVALWLFGTSCILGPDIQVEEEESNSPPKIVLDAVVPEDSGWFTLDIDEDSCASVVFGIGQVKDKDVRDSFYYAWFVNWNQGEKDPYAGWFFANTTGEVTRTGPELPIPLSEFIVDENYSVRVFIADRPAEIGDDQAILFPGDPDGQYDSYQWSFVAKQGECYCK